MSGEGQTCRCGRVPIGANGLCATCDDELTDRASIVERLPVITLWQPWASLIFSGHKRCETRSFAPPVKYVGKRIAIHAAARPCPRVGDELADLCYDAFGCGWNYSLPRGAILGTAILGGFYPTEKLSPPDDDRIAGDWSEGRYAWQLLDVEPLAAPLPAKGKQGWWSAESALLAKVKPNG